ncbi:hypothetical protein [Chryseobacterium sp. JUb7]|uniref:hypothetical protein n=1 Tax=Chryseobacterium sp. JUb7 TaxID=2940599 RepID=UPI0021684C05|nr:hypothetical protein [Chryseobacterium sp. JUb7]MCS3532236.1 preprotein translocase subunit SecG [Chryseobacterium sp. JUb7]
MKEEKFVKFSDQELFDKRKSLKTLTIINAVLIGFLIGISIYGAIKNGFGFFTFFPLIFVFLLIKTKSDSKELENEIKSRNLK